MHTAALGRMMALRRVGTAFSAAKPFTDASKLADAIITSLAMDNDANDAPNDDLGPQKAHFLESLHRGDGEALRTFTF